MNTTDPLGTVAATGDRLDLFLWPINIRNTMALTYHPYRPTAHGHTPNTWRDSQRDNRLRIVTTTLTGSRVLVGVTFTSHSFPAWTSRSRTCIVGLSACAATSLSRNSFWYHYPHRFRFKRIADSPHHKFRLNRDLWWNVDSQTQKRRFRAGPHLW